VVRSHDVKLLSIVCVTHRRQDTRPCAAGVVAWYTEVHRPSVDKMSRPCVGGVVAWDTYVYQQDVPTGTSGDW